MGERANCTRVTQRNGILGHFIPFSQESADSGCGLPGAAAVSAALGTLAG